MLGKSSMKSVGLFKENQGLLQSLALPYWLVSLPKERGPDEGLEAYSLNGFVLGFSKKMEKWIFEKNGSESLGLLDENREGSPVPMAGIGRGQKKGFFEKSRPPSGRPCGAPKII